MSKPKPPTYRTTNWRAYNAGLRQRGSLQIWFDPEMVWLAEPSGKRGRPATFTDGAIQACLTLKALFGLPLRQTTGLVESLLKLAGLDWPVPDFSTLSRRQKGLNVAIPYRPSTGALHLLIDSTGIKSEGEGEWFRPRNTGLPSLGSGARSIWGLMRIRLKSGRLRSPVAGLVMLPCSPNCCARSPLTSLSTRSVQTVPMTPAPVMPQLQTATLVPSFPRARTLDRGSRTHPARGPETTPSARHAALVAQSGGGGAAIIAEAASRQNARLQAARCACHGPRLRQAGGRTPDQGRDPEPIYGPRNAANSTRRMTLPIGRGSSTSD